MQTTICMEFFGQFPFEINKTIQPESINKSTQAKPILLCIMRALVQNWLIFFLKEHSFFHALVFSQDKCWQHDWSHAFIVKFVNLVYLSLWKHLNIFGCDRCPCPLIQILPWVYFDFNQILSRFFRHSDIFRHVQICPSTCALDPQKY